jgi:hypothetical protein
MPFGDFELTSACDAVFRLDGGAMIGAAARPLWERRVPPCDLGPVLLHEL